MPKKSHRIIHRRAKSHRRRAEPTAPHSVIATLLGAAAVAVPLITPNPNNGNNTVLSSLAIAAEDAAAGDTAKATGDLGYALDNFVAGIVNGFLPMIGLAVGGAAVGWGGRKYAKSTTNVNRKWRVI